MSMISLLHERIGKARVLKWQVSLYFSALYMTPTLTSFICTFGPLKMTGQISAELSNKQGWVTELFLGVEASLLYQHSSFLHFCTLFYAHPHSCGEGTTLDIQDVSESKLQMYQFYPTKTLFFSEQSSLIWTWYWEHSLYHVNPLKCAQMFLQGC